MRYKKIKNKFLACYLEIYYVEIGLIIMNLPVIEQYLKKNPLRLIDIGARWGTHKRWERFANVLNVVAFDADKEECEKLNQKSACTNFKIRYLPFALGEENNKRVLIHICRDPGCSSLFVPNRDFIKDYPYHPDLDVLMTKEVVLRRLDTICNEYDFSPDYIKIDTQGYELPILKGAGALLKNILVAELESEFVPIYQNQPLFSDVDIFMRENNFLLRGLQRSHWRRMSKQYKRTYRGGQLVHCDALYIARNVLENPDELNLETALKVLVLFSAYNQDDLIENFIGSPIKSLASLSSKERHSLAKFLIKPRPFFGKIGRILFCFCDHYGLRKLVNEGRPLSGGYWDDPDFF